jgi:hypothetical protein
MLECRQLTGKNMGHSGWISQLHITRIKFWRQLIDKEKDYLAHSLEVQIQGHVPIGLVSDEDGRWQWWEQMSDQVVISQARKRERGGKTRGNRERNRDPIIHFKGMLSVTHGPSTRYHILKFHGTS